MSKFCYEQQWGKGSWGYDKGGEPWDVQLFLVQLMFCSTLITFDNKKIGHF